MAIGGLLLMRALLCVLVAVPVLAPSGPADDAFAFLQPTVVVSHADRQLLERGEAVVTILDAPRGELAVFSAIRLDSEVTLARAAGWLERVEALRSSRYTLASGRFSPSPEIADLEDLILDDPDIDDIRRCRPGKCDLKLSAAEIAVLQAAIAGAGAEWRLAVQPAFRRVLVRRVAAYLAGGHTTLGPLADRKLPRPVAALFDGILERSEFLHSQFPQLAGPLSTCPSAALPDRDSFVYWSKERLGGKPVITATHVTIASSQPASSRVLVAGVQIFATHYLDASLGVTAVIRDAQSSASYFVYVNRSHVDVLEGFWGGLARSIVERRIRKDGPAVLREVAARMSRGDAPPRGPRPPEARP